MYTWQKMLTITLWLSVYMTENAYNHKPYSNDRGSNHCDWVYTWQRMLTITLWLSVYMTENAYNHTLTLKRLLGANVTACFDKGQMPKLANTLCICTTQLKKKLSTFSAISPHTHIHIHTHMYTHMHRMLCSQLQVTPFMYAGTTRSKGMEGTTRCSAHLLGRHKCTGLTVLHFISLQSLLLNTDRGKNKTTHCAIAGPAWPRGPPFCLNLATPLIDWLTYFSLHACYTSMATRPSILFKSSHSFKWLTDIFFNAHLLDQHGHVALHSV